MTVEAWRGTFDKLLRTSSRDEQLTLRAPLRDEPDYFTAVAEAYLANPFFQLTDEEVARLSDKLRPVGIARLIAARHEAMSATAPKYVVFCMPKSGSSFVSSALQHALEIPKVSLTSFGATPLSSHFGMNPREQEIDELAVAKAAILHGATGFTAQHHTRYTDYLARQMLAYRLTPIVTIRNILDTIVSFDDMMLRARHGDPEQALQRDAPFALPLNYPKLAPDDRYRLLAHSLGVWQVQFHLSWRRCQRQAYISPIIIRYETDVIDQNRFVETMAGTLGLHSPKVDRLRDYAQRPDPKRSRLNIGRPGRGRKKVPADARDFLVNYAQLFADEIPEDEIAYLLD